MELFAKSSNPFDILKQQLNYPQQNPFEKEVDNWMTLQTHILSNSHTLYHNHSPHPIRDLLSTIMYWRSWSDHSFDKRVRSHPIMLVLDRAHFSSNSSFIELQKFEFEHVTNSIFFHFSSLSLRLETCFLYFGPNILSISSFIEFGFVLTTNHQARAQSNFKSECLNSSSF